MVILALRRLAVAAASLGAILCRQPREGRGRNLFVSGVNQHVDLEGLLRSSGDGSSCCVVIGHRAVDTLGNAGETAEWMRQRGFHSLRLVAAWYHMRRSLLVFERAMPEIEIVPHPVFPDQIAHEYWWARRHTAALLVNEDGKYLATLARPFVERLVPAGHDPSPSPLRAVSEPAAAEFRR